MNKFVLVKLLHTMSDSDWSEESSEESESESEGSRPKQPRHIVKISRYVEDVVGAYSNKTFQSYFRISREIVYNLIDLLNRHSPTTNQRGGTEKVSNEKSFLITLWYLSNTETFRQVSDRFDVSLSSAHRILLRVLNFILSLCKYYIKWPAAEEQRLVSAEFKKIKGIDNIIGAVDGCHVKIVKPRDEAEVYVNRNGYHSLLLQGIVNCKKEFIDVYAGEPGSLHDAPLLRNSTIYTKAADPAFFANSFLIGDSAYPSMPWLVPPFKDNGFLTQNHKTFNFRHSSTRIVVEHAFGLLKGRFHRLQHLDNINIKTAVKCIMATCVLHNICIAKNDDTVISLADLTDDLISDARPFDSYLYGKVCSRREQLFQQMFK